ncbi:hypothetical protein BFJ72_g5947 [Fusarium proliferatum]|uniref:Uncharacterized protein n=1 Tax=Gibberella intermedia TaxID=948311 RepID=A0A420THP6_GIBIN|nr:hypothetical protein BFJ72_g5947 [Fusarium proliferatum]
MLPPVKSILLAEDEATNSTLQYVKENPGSIMAMGLGAGMVIAPGLVVAPAISAAGFTTEDVSAGLLAAGIQSGIGSVVAGSAFATLQSAGAGGFDLAVVNGVVQAAGVVVGGSGVAAKLKGQGNGDNDNGDQEETDGTHEGNDADEMVSQSKKT